MSADGSAQAHITSQYFGQSASTWRTASKEQGKDELKKSLERIFARRLGGGVTLDHVTASDRGDQLDLSLDLDVMHLGQRMMDKLLVVRPGALAPDHGYTFPKIERKQPIQLSGRMRTDRVTLHFPAGFAIDEMPGVDIAGPYGTYHSSWKATGDVVTLVQSLEIKTVTAPRHGLRQGP